MHEAEVELRVDVAAFGCAAVPEGRLFVVLGQALAAIVHQGELVLGPGIAGFGERYPLV
jgi:hypothetical protein